ncbi:MAG: hormogonium polysaccharide biosynthesis protein HpsA [Leptolyngbyaceae cyanobacterium]
MSSRRMGRLQRIVWQLLKRFMQTLLRLLFRLTGRRAAEAGFVFPTTVLLILMVSLTAGALTYRAYSRSTQVIVERQQQIVTNAATPAVDRAKAKLEYLFNRDLRPAPRVPPSNAIENLLRAIDPNMLSGTPEYDRLAIQSLGSTEDDDIYTLEDERRVNLDGGNEDDNAWIFNADVNGDGDIDDGEVVVYGIFVDHLVADGTAEGLTFSDEEREKAQNLIARNSPLTAQANDPCVRGEEAAVQEEPISGEGWARVSALKGEKTFQVVGFAADLRDGANAGDVVSTIEFQQIREASLGNKWGAWFRYDLEATPGPEFNWNGAMHTQGSLFMSNNFNAYMISSTASCAYDTDASEITLGATEPNGFRGQLVLGNANLGFGTDQGRPTIHVEDDANPDTPDRIDLRDNRDTVAGADDSISDIYLNPIELYLNDTSEHVNTASWAQDREPDEEFPDRVRNVRDNELIKISLDDTYRADDRFGPRSEYGPEGDEIDIPAGSNIGEDILNQPALTNPSNGFDGYWERRAASEGTRFIVGQRLELGNANGWNYDPIADAVVADSDPLYPPIDLPTNRTGEHYQRKSLRDNVAAVQGMVVYHYETDSGQTPAVCIATTAHHGTYQTIANSRTFRQRVDDGTRVSLDFLTGNGTNGWEFDPVNPSDANVQQALENLANFAGDPLGGAPSFTPPVDNEVHPFPYMSMWGDFSNLQRVLNEGNGSIADDSTLDTAACTLALLAYNIDAVDSEHAALDASNGYDSITFTDIANRLNVLELATPGFLDQKRSLTGWKTVLGDDSNALGESPREELIFDIAWHRWMVERDRIFGFAQGVAPNCNAANLAASYGLTATLASRLEKALCDDRPHYPALHYIFPLQQHNGNGTAAGDELQPATEDYIEQTVSASAYGQNNTFDVVNVAALAALANPQNADDFVLPNPAPAVNNQFFATEWGANANAPGANTPDERPWDLVVTNPTRNGFVDSFGVSVLDKVVYSGRENTTVRLLDINVNELMTNNNVSDRWFAGQDTDGNERFGLTYAFREDAIREDAIVRPDAATFANCNGYEDYAELATPACVPQTAADALDWTDPPLSTDHLISLKPVDYLPDPMRQPHGFRLRNGADFERDNEVVSGLSFISDNAVAIQGDFNLHIDGGEIEEFQTQVFPVPSVANDDGFYTVFYDRDDPETSFADSTQDTWRPSEVLGDAVYLFSNAFRDGFVEAAYASDAAGVTGGDNGIFQYDDAGAGNGLVSFQNMNRPANDDDEVPAAAQLLREDPNAPPNATNNAPESPIYFDRNGHVYVNVPAAWNQLDDYGAGDGDADEFEYYVLNNFGGGTPSEAYRQDNLLPASETQINALIFSGIVPSRRNQIYGGLHNFPRMNEFWDENRLLIAGGFFQLFFSHTSTGPFDMEVWEYNPALELADNLPTNDRNIGYYEPPNRVWGYDVALQYAEQPPIAARFISLGTPRSEFSRELPVDDAYVNLLRCAEVDGQRIDPGADCQ